MTDNDAFGKHQSSDAGQSTTTTDDMSGDQLLHPVVPNRDFPGVASAVRNVLPKELKNRRIIVDKINRIIENSMYKPPKPDSAMNPCWQELGYVLADSIPSERDDEAWAQTISKLILGRLPYEEFLSQESVTETDNCGDCANKISY